jgi:hypothetical protein
MTCVGLEVMTRSVVCGKLSDISEEHVALPPSSESTKTPSKKPVRKQVAYYSTLKMEATCSSEMSIDIQWTTRHYIPDIKLFMIGG